MHKTYHEKIWDGFEDLAEKEQTSLSRLALMAGLNSTAFNHSKRFSVANHRPRWPSTETLAKVLEVTNYTLGDFARLIGEDSPDQSNNIPMIGLNRARFSDAFSPTGVPQIDEAQESLWEFRSGDLISPISLPKGAFGKKDHPLYWLLKIDDQTYKPQFNEGSLLLISTEASIQKDTLILLCHANKELTLCRLLKQTLHRIEIQRLNNGAIEALTLQDVAWLCRILWVQF